jgi:hypothetical protein
MAGLSRGRFRTEGRTDSRTMAAGASVTWTHYSVLFEVTWGKKVRVRADIGPSARTSSPPSPLPPSPLPHPFQCGREKKRKKTFYFIF